MDKFPICTHCGFTWGEYRARGLLGCPQCYVAFGEALQADLLWLHGTFDQREPVSRFAAHRTVAEETAEHRPGARASANLSASASDPATASNPAMPMRAARDPERVAQWRERLADALRVENYEEAARLRRLIQGSAAEGPAADSSAQDAEETK